MKYWWTQLGELSFIESTLQLEIIILTTTYYPSSSSTTGISNCYAALSLLANGSRLEETCLLGSWHGCPKYDIESAEYADCTQGSNDGFLHKYKDQDLSAYTVVKIQGDNHAGVAHYEPQTFPLKDGEREITLEKQQELTATAVSDFLLP